MTNSVPPAVGYYSRPASSLQSYQDPDSRTNPVYPNPTRTIVEMADRTKKYGNKRSAMEWLGNMKVSTKPKPKPVHSGTQDTTSTTSQPYSPPPPPKLPLYTTHTSFDEQGRYTGAEYVYNGKELERKPCDLPPVIDRTTSFGSTKGETGQNWMRSSAEEDEKSRSESPFPPVPAHSGLPPSTVSGSYANDTVPKPEPNDRRDAVKELEHIEMYLSGAMYKHPELAGEPNESAENTIKRIIDLYKSLSVSPSKNSNSPLDQSGIMRTEYIKKNDELRSANTHLQESAEILKDKIVRMTKEMHELKGQISTLEFKNAELASSHEAKLRTDYNAKQRELDNMKNMYEDQLRRTRANASSEHDTTIRKYEQTRGRIEELKREINGWRNDYEELRNEKRDVEIRLSNAKADEEASVLDMEAKCERKMQKERKEFNDRIKGLESEITRLNILLQNEITHKEEEIRSQKQELIENHEKEKVALCTVIEDFKLTRSKREHFKGLTDSEVSTQYKRLANSIEDFSRLDWEFLKEGQWPFPDSQMRQMSRNARKLKQQIVQNTLWMLLFEFVFRSPFRILGAEGAGDDAPWASIYSSGASSYDWTELPNEVERARFEKAKIFMNAIEPSAGDSETKRSFEDAVTSAMDVICRALVKVATVQAKERRSLDNIVRLAAKIWLESCSQRYRLTVILPDGSCDVLSYPGTNNSPLKLVVRPDLKRYGDSQGKGLLRGESVAGWQSQTESVIQ